MFRFDNSYSRLPSALFAKQHPVPVPMPRLVIFNDALAKELGLDAAFIKDKKAAAVFSGNQLPEGSTPLAQAYAGHQFGHFTMLGDGRAILLGEHLTREGKRVDIQLKGSGRTAFSRSGDGRAALGPMLREYVISEAMYALGIPTTRSLAVVTTGGAVLREKPLPGAILTRIAASHVRVGTFEYAARLGDREIFRALADYTIARHYPELQEAEQPYYELLRAVIDRQASLMARWMLVGFVHGVMNTDNMALSGETIDYGPCAFMDHYDPNTVFSSIDRSGRYAYGNQPGIAQWNLTCFAETLLPLFSTEQPRAIAMAEEAIGTFGDRFQHYWLMGMRAKLGLRMEEENDTLLISTLLQWMEQEKMDFTNLFRGLSQAQSNAYLYEDARWMEWQNQWQARYARESHPFDEVQQLMKQTNPAVIARNHRVEEVLAAASEQEDYAPLERLLKILKTPYATCTDSFYRDPNSTSGYRTFCGT